MIKIYIFEIMMLHFTHAKATLSDFHGAVTTKKIFRKLKRTPFCLNGPYIQFESQKWYLQF